MTMVNVLCCGASHFSDSAVVLRVILNVLLGLVVIVCWLLVCGEALFAVCVSR